MKTKKNIMEILKHVYLLIITFIVLTPIYYLLVTTFKSGTEAAAKPMALPSFWDITPYINAFEKMQYPRAFGNTLFITICAVFGIVMCSTMCGYVLNRKEKSKITKIIFLVILSGMMFPYQMAVLGLYKLVRSLYLMNTLTAVIFIDIAINIPFATFLMKNSISSVPIELEEAARIDGAGVFRIFGTIVLPLLKPMIATIVILTTLHVWNDFMGPLYFIQKREKDVILQEVYRNIGQFSTDWTSLFPMMVLGILPLLVFYIFMQKYIISGVMVSFVWSFIFTGAIPNLAKILHIDALANISWFGNAGTAAFTVILVTTWQSTGFLMMLYITGLQTIQKDVLEAAVLDGCTGIKKIIYIQLPLLMPTITINLFVSIAGAFKAFDIPLSLTGGGPANSTQTIALNIYNDAFGSFKMGYGSAKSIILFLLVGIIALIQLKITRKREVQM